MTDWEIVVVLADVVNVRCISGSDDAKIPVQNWSI
jgi:hypothetical protein